MHGMGIVTNASDDSGLLMKGGWRRQDYLRAEGPKRLIWGLRKRMDGLWLSVADAGG